jgi:hypothetical protein
MVIGRNHKLRLFGFQMPQRFQIRVGSVGRFDREHETSLIIIELFCRALKAEETNEGLVLGKVAIG